MNKKGKNKKGKVPNPMPVQEDKGGDTLDDVKSDKIEDVAAPIGDKKEDIGIIGEVIQNTEEKVESVKEKRVPEIVSEIIPPAVDVKDEDAPKKPKRNRGKKKKGKDDDFDDNMEEKFKETDSQVLIEETKVEIPEAESKPEELPLITPTARKKKNKKKNADQKADDLISGETDQEPPNAPLKSEEKGPELKDSVPEIKQEDVKTEFSCTAAFQKILDDKDEPEIKMDEKVEDSAILLEKITGEVENVEIKTEKTEKGLSPLPQVKAATPIKELEPIQEPPATENQPQTLIDIETSTPSAILLEPVEGKQEETAKETTVIESPEPLVGDLSPKPKAKIAKPVEKKRKGKHEATTDTPQDISVLEPPKDKESSAPAPLELLESKLVDTENASKVELPTQVEITSDITFTAPDEDEKLIAQEFELLAEKAMGKKRKKGAKMPKSLDIAAGVQEPKIESDIKPAEVKDTTKEQLAVITEILTPQTDQQEFIIMSQKTDMPITVDNVKETVQEAPKPIELPEFKGKELLTPEKVDEKLEFTKTEGVAPLTEDKQKTDNKSGKKRKKSPKPPKKMEETPKVEERPITPTPVVRETSKSEDATQQSLSEKIDASNITRMYDIEISSIKADESEGSACETVPDITHPRASSQQLRDDNNNTVIREIFPLEPVLGDVPVRQESAQAPVRQEEMRTSPKDEKTDIKSKMMEVNQDMEELRLSIERSLAELTSIEKSEENIEKEFETTRTKAKNISDLLFDTGESAANPIPIIEKEIEKSVPLEVSMNVPLERSKERSKSPMVSKNKQKTDGKQKNISEKSTADQSKATPIPMPSFAATIAEASLSTDTKTNETPPKIDDKLIGFSPTEMLLGFDKPLIEEQKLKESTIPVIPPLPVEEKKTEPLDSEKKVTEEPKELTIETPTDVPPVCPARKDNKGKHKKKKGKQDSQATSTAQSSTPATTSQTTQEAKKEEKTDSKSESKSDSKGKSQSSEKSKQQASNVDAETTDDALPDADYEPIENFEDALTSSIDDVNKTFEMIVKESQEQNNPKINIIAPDEEKSPVSPPKNLLGHPDIPVRSNKRDFKKEKDKIPNEITARVKIKDSVEVERKQSKNTQTNNAKELSKDYKMDDNNDFVYKYSFRKVFLQSSCHVCKKSLGGVRVPCSYCNLLFYCSNKHKDEDWPQHQALCFAVSTIVHLKDQKFIYGDAKNLTGHDYRLIRMQMIVSCEKVLKRRLVPWEQEALLYPRVCAHVPCREWRQSKLSDCQGCGQISFCTDNADHFPKSHSRWCKSYSLYEKLVCYQQTKGRLEPKMPTKVLREPQMIPEKINEVLASMYEEKIDINDIQYAALTQLATAPLTAAYCHQLCRSKAGSIANGVNKKTSFTIHVVGAELQFEADALNKWEVFFLHLRPDLQELRVVLINYNLNPSNLPLELLGKIKLCDNCRQSNRRVVFSFQDKRTYADYKSSEDFVVPDIVCAFNPSIQRSSVYNGKDPWPSAINAILKLKVPFIITGYTITELHKDCIRIKECFETGYNFIAEPKYNNFASVRPDRNFISDDEMPLLFKNYCFAIISA
uniref:MYND-type domain-containing protein n=1 Tax=Heliothis virescens TaxID=7102 RepID=A0A2A4JYP6_HELVI